MRPRLWSLAVLLLPCLAAACIGPASTPLATVPIHVVNRLSNVLVTQVVLHPGSVVGTPPPPDGFGYIAPCGGEADVQATMVHPDAASLALWIDQSGELDRTYPRENLDAASAYLYQLSIIWTSAALKGGEWLVVQPDRVVLTAAAPTAAAAAGALPSGACAAWIGEPEPS